ncbi:major facilitator superfamily domain-containing protein [Fusarium redolens]|uniref:Major facilitator superfamily domain-containing protein n=1 Tax=Fusarium redolens TaxID=48865 RepID=A0A9P9HL13_FUSRE|nr:major facilitator superfamily domain-containing protein [Fusarium redolens]KAH7258923.1 major facilitator superfamily domain-containing protein [Fusarium redolens]
MKTYKNQSDSEQSAMTPEPLAVQASKPTRQWWHWHEPDTSKQEKWLIFKLDAAILTYTCLTFFVKYLDQTNITNAYVSGMKEDLNLHGNELNWLTTYFNIGIIIGAPFSTMMLTLIKPRWWLPACTMAWSLLVLGMHKAEAVKTLYILRFFTGLCESGAMPGSFYIIGSWYRRSEISRRTTLFWFSSVGGQMLSGYIQAGLYRNMNGRLGLAAWRWLFVLDFFYQYEPKAKKVWWMTEEERQRCIERISDEGRDAELFHWDRALVKQVLTSWQLYAFCIAWGFMELTCGVNLQRWMTLWIKSLRDDGKPKYSTEKVNAIPTAVGCTGLVWMLLSAFVADSYQNRALPICVLGCVQLFSYIVLLTWPNSEAFIMAAYYLASAYSALSPLISAWLNSSCGGKKQLRALTTGLMTSIGYAVETVAQQEMFPISQAPRFQQTHGYAFGIAWIVVMIVWCSACLPLMERPFSSRLQVLMRIVR